MVVWSINVYLGVGHAAVDEGEDAGGAAAAHRAAGL